MILLQNWFYTQLAMQKRVVIQFQVWNAFFIDFLSKVIHEVGLPEVVQKISSKSLKNLPKGYGMSPWLEVP